jgi:hypothetical protein
VARNVFSYGEVVLSIVCTENMPTWSLCSTDARAKLPELGSVLSFPYIAILVKKKKSFTSTLIMCLHGMMLRLEVSLPFTSSLSKLGK